jgi:hypothetical protein
MRSGPINQVPDELAENRAVVCLVNDTSARRREMADLRRRGHDVVHIPPPPGFSDWEQYSRIFGRDKASVREYVVKVLTDIGRPELADQWQA